jgi:hypothetical protein
MAARVIVPVGADERLDAAVAKAFDRLRSNDAAHAALLFDLSWQPTMELVDVLSVHLAASQVEALTLIHPSATMTFLASAVAMRCKGVTVTAQRSIYDDGEEEDETTDATSSRTMFVMNTNERVEDFVRQSVTEARRRVVRRFALVFADAIPLPADLADVLAEELLHSGAKEVGLIHASTALEIVADTLQLRLPEVRIALASSRTGSSSGEF